MEGQRQVTGGNSRYHQRLVDRGQQQPVAGSAAGRGAGQPKHEGTFCNRRSNTNAVLVRKKIREKKTNSGNDKCSTVRYTIFLYNFNIFLFWPNSYWQVSNTTRNMFCNLKATGMQWWMIFEGGRNSVKRAEKCLLRSRKNGIANYGLRLRRHIIMSAPQLRTNAKHHENKSMQCTRVKGYYYKKKNFPNFPCIFNLKTEPCS